MHRQTKLRLQLLLGTALLAAPVTALAQTAPAPAANSPVGLDDIVVTATKRETNLQDTPISISVVNSEALQNRHVQSLMDLADGAVPSLRVATFEARQSALTIGIRGIVPNDANQPAREQGVGVYVDGVYLARQHGLASALLDIERVEVLKGPQGTLFGRNTEGGALSLVTKKPTGVFGMRAIAGVGNLESYNSELHVDFPAIGDFAFKVDGVLQVQGPVTENILPGETGFGQYDRRGLRFQTRWTPSENFTADLAADVGKDKNTPFYSQLLNFNPNGLTVVPFTSASVPSGSIRGLSPLVQVEGSKRMTQADIGVPQQWSVDDTRGVDLHMSYRPTDALEIRSITAYRDLDVEQYDNIAGAHRPPVVGPNGKFSRYSLAGFWQHQFSQELQAVGSLGDSIDYVGGVFYFKETVSDDASTPSTNQWNADGTGYTILDPTPTIRGFRSMDRKSTAHSESKAIYGQATWTPASMDALHLTVGGRYTWDDKDGVLELVNNDLPIVNGVKGVLRFNSKVDRFDPLVTLAYDVTDSINVYGKYSTGYRAGGASSRSLTYRSFDPEEVKAYELGLKSDLFDRRVRLNAAIYAMNRTDSQIDFSLVTVQGASTRNTLETINAPGTTKIRGLELEGQFRATDNLTLSASYAYTDAKVPDTVNPFNGQTQKVFIAYTPENAASFAADWNSPFMGATLKAHVDANYADANHSFEQFEIKNDSSFVVNARVAIADITTRDGGPLLEVALWSRNLLDETYVYRRDPSNRNTLGDYGNFNNPRTFGIELRASY
ncbi:MULTISPECIES: TonB-dependent receptor [unclassified Brevundimonas]|uniref:TonB-dependent receptor n=1 Tax=unclassified Brevundimonas TaxID=2622653 RepID=UPI002006109D|nr:MULTISPECIES: TonB-dependent receptor [unclassified Brevundimonas]MCK6104601.1 TonB-dependent receptor [Brevundimonas sp. EYE_349]